MLENNYHREWRLKNPNRYHLIQLRWYYKNRDRIMALQSRPESGKEDIADKWLRRFD